MNIWIRVLMLLLKSIGKKRVSPFKKMHHEFIIGPTEADLKIMGNARYILFGEVVRFDYMIRTGILKNSFKYKWIPLVASQSIRYIRPLKRFEKFQLETELKAWDDKWFYIEHIFKKNGKKYAIIMVKGCFRGRKMITPPNEIFKILGYEIESPLIPEHFIKWCEAEDKHIQSL